MTTFQCSGTWLGACARQFRIVLGIRAFDVDFVAAWGCCGDLFTAEYIVTVIGAFAAALVTAAAGFLAGRAAVKHLIVPARNGNHMPAFWSQFLNLYFAFSTLFLEMASFLASMVSFTLDFITKLRTLLVVVGVILIDDVAGTYTRMPAGHTSIASFLATTLRNVYKIFFGFHKALVFAVILAVQSQRITDGILCR